MQTATGISIQDTNSIPQTFSNNECHNCSRQKICLAQLLDENELAAFNTIVKHSKKLNRGDFLYRAGDEFSSIYTIRSGSIKTFIDDEEGREQILGFSIQGDILALDGANLNTYPTSAQALETTYVCEIPFGRYMELAVQIPVLYQQLLTQMSHQIREDEEHALLLGTKSAEQRLATLLINFSNRYSKKGFSKSEFYLHMSRRDIGNYLSAAMETISRLFSRLQANGLIEVRGKFIKIIDLEELQKFTA